MEKETKVIDIFKVGAYVKGSEGYPCTRLADTGTDQIISPEFLAGACLSLYAFVLGGCEESTRIEFEKSFKEYFDKHWGLKENYTIKDEESDIVKNKTPNEN